MIRRYQNSDYDQLRNLYQHSEWYGGVFDEFRDGYDTLAKKIAQDSEAILVCEENGNLKGTISLIEDGRVAWLYRFAIKDNDEQIAQMLFNEATKILKSRGHKEVLVYSKPDSKELNKRYKNLSMIEGGTYNCFYAKLE